MSPPDSNPSKRPLAGPGEMPRTRDTHSPRPASGLADLNPSKRLPRDLRLIEQMLQLPDNQLRAAVFYLLARLEARQKP